MKKLFAVILFAVLFFGCSSSSYVQNYRFAGESDTHSFNVVQNALGNSFTLFIDQKEIVTATFGVFRYESNAQGKWNDKQVSLECRYEPGFLGIGRKYTCTTLVNNERVAMFEF